ncbi:MAG: hypothetical protein E7324_10735, partial [Clostridiales bacterium]|nr:hypothetical protein [Clostridiales bacterium]
MSTAAAKKKKQAAPALATTGRGAAFCIALGIVMLTMGMMLLISLLWGNYSHVLGRLNAALQGLGGTLCLPLPLFFCWAGIKLLVSTRHKVSVRDILIFFLLYLMVLAGYTLLAQVSDNNSYISYMDYVGKRNARQAMAAPESFSAYLQQAFTQKTHGPGGLLGMLVAYPVWMVLGRIVGFIFILALSVVLIFLLLRANPGELMRKLSDSSEQMRQRRLQRQQERMAAEQTAQPAPPVQDAASPLPPLQPGQTVRREETAVSPAPYYQAAPIYQAAPARPVADDSFYPVQPDLYDQRYPLHNHKENTPPPSPAWATAPQQEEVIPPPDPIYPDVMAPTEETADPVQEETIPAPGPLSAVPLDDEVPWDEPAAATETEPLIPAPEPAPVSAPVQAEKAAHSPRHEAPVSKAKEAPLPKTDPIPQEKEPTAPTSWATQVRRKQAEIEMPEHTTAKGDPKPVYTDPVMPIT